MHKLNDTAQRTKVNPHVQQSDTTLRSNNSKSHWIKVWNILDRSNTDRMEVTVKVVLRKLDSSEEIRRIPMSVVNKGTHPGMSGQFGLLLARIASTFPSLKDKTFDLTWKDCDGDAIVMSSDEELSEAIAASTGQTLKVFITEPEMATKGDKQVETSEPQPRPVPTAPPPPLYEHGPVGGHPLYPSAPGQPPYPPVLGHPSRQPPHTYPMIHGDKVVMIGPGQPPYPPVLGHPSRQPRHAYPMIQGDKVVMIGPGRPGVTIEGLPPTVSPDKKAWKKALRAQVPGPHRRWAKGYIRQWRSANVENATTSTSSDGEKGRTLTRDEAGVPEVLARWLDMILPRAHASWAQGNAELDWNNFRDIKPTVPVEFQNWCQWYLKKHFEPKRKPELKCEGKDKASVGQGQDKDWKAIRKEMKEWVPRQHRLWTKLFIKQWQEDHLDGVNITTSSSGTDTGSEAEATARDATQEEIIIPADYPRWLRKFLNWKYANKGVTLRVPDQKVIDGDWNEFKDSVPKEYRKWARSYVNHRLNRGKKSCNRNQELTQPRDTYQKWLFAFQRRWLEQVAGNRVPASRFSEFSVSGERTGAGIDGDRTRPRAQVFDMERLRDVVESSDSEDETDRNPQQKIPKDFRRWARDALSEWDGMTLPPGNSGAPQYGSGLDQDDIPPRMLNWMAKIMTRMQIRRMKTQVKAERQEMKAHKRAEKAEKKAAREGFKAARRSLKVARQAIKFRYV